MLGSSEGLLILRIHGLQYAKSVYYLPCTAWKFEDYFGLASKASLIRFWAAQKWQESWPPESQAAGCSINWDLGKMAWVYATTAIAARSWWLTSEGVRSL